MKADASPTDAAIDEEDQGDALCRACARARTTVVPALGRALDHPLAQLLTGLLTVFALFGDDVQRSVVQTSSRRPTLANRRSASSPSTARPTPTTSLASRTPW